MPTFANGESGSSIRTKLNAAVEHVDRLVGLLSITSSASSVILDAASPSKIRVTGSVAQTIVFPDPATLTIGWFYVITNDTGQNVTVQSTGLNTIQTIPANTTSLFQCILDSGTTAASWISDFIGFSGITGSGNIVRAVSPAITGTLTVAAVAGSSYVKGGFTAHAAGTLAMALGTNMGVSVTPNADATLTTTVPPSGSTCFLIINTRGTTSYTITFGTGFRSTGTLATGTVSARSFVLEYVSDGTSLIETRRTAAIA